MSLKLFHSKDYHNFLHDVVENEILETKITNNESLWVKMGNQLEIERVPKSQISTIVRKDIEDMLFKNQYENIVPREEVKYTKTKYFEVMREHGWTDPFMARHVNVDPSADQENSSINTPNKDMKELCYDLIDLGRSIIDKSNNPEINLEETFGKKVMKEFYKQEKTIIFNIHSAIDHKTKVSKNNAVFLLELLATIPASMNKIGEKFFEENLIRLKEQRTLSIRTGKPVPFITLKQATKFKNGDKICKQIILKPLSRDAAIYLGYTGNECSCGSLRIRETECFDCDKKHAPYHLSLCSECFVPLYVERILHIDNTGRCEKCDQIIDLPQELIDDAKLRMQEKTK